MKSNVLYFFLIHVIFFNSCAKDNSIPVVKRVHTVSIHIQNFEIYNSIFNFLTQDLKFPIDYGNIWTPDSKRNRVYAGIFAGNINLEPCGPYPHINYASRNFDALFYGITFEPYESSSTSATELDKRGILHNDPTMFMSVTDSQICKQNLYVGFIDIRNKDKYKAKRDSLSSVLKSDHYNSVGIKCVDEVHIGYTDDANLKKWQDFLKPFEEIKTNVWRIGDGPALRLIKRDIKEIIAIVFKVESLQHAVDYLREREMLGVANKDEAEINVKKTYGLKILLREH